MKHTLIIFSFSLLLMTGCKKEEIIVYNTQNTPDLSNPIIQKLTNVVWYKEGLSLTEQWTSQNNILKPADYVSSLLYNAAWASITLYRDGTSNMVYLPPFIASTAIHCKGNWQVSTEEENTIILSTKTPVSSVTGKIKVLNMEAKDNLSVAEVSIDFGDRLLKVNLINESPYTYDMNSPAFVSAIDYNWFASQEIQATPLKAEDFVGAWSIPTGDVDGKTFSSPDFPTEGLKRIAYVEDLLTQTPSFAYGMTFNLKNGGKADIYYQNNYFFNSEFDTDKTVVSNATWSVKGNKILIETDEEMFLSIGEGLFGLSSHVANLISLGITPKTKQNIRILPKQFYSIELISRNEKGFWARITTQSTVLYTFLSKAEFDSSSTINIKDLF
ncbi:MAG: hypothetical protein KF746_10200 [Chitinophagaceae bacterium]|nr:hypothetical protein [Chitinophagaceae bacterium]